MDYDLKFKITAPFYMTYGEGDDTSCELVADVGDIVEGYIGEDGRPTIVSKCGGLHMYADVEPSGCVTACGRAEPVVAI